MKTLSSKQPTQRFNAPLMSWDIFISFYHRSLQLGTDAQKLEKMEETYQWQRSWNYSDLLHHQHQLIIVTDAERKIQFISSNLWEITGYSADAVLNQHLASFRNADSNPILVEQMKKAINAHQSFETEFVVHSQTGRPFPTRVVSHPLLNREGRLVNYIIFLKPI